jgi:hypothetical protein
LIFWKKRYFLKNRKKVVQLYIVSAAILLLIPFPTQSKDLEGYLFEKGLQFLTNPGDLLLDLHTDVDDVSPVKSEDRISVRINIFPALVPITTVNLSAKARLWKEGAWLPQNDLIGTYWTNIGATIASENAEELQASLSGYSIGGTISRSFGKGGNIRLFAGLKYVNLSLKADLSSVIESENGEDGTELEITYLDINPKDLFVFSGLVYRSHPLRDRLVMAQVGYGIRHKKIVSKISISYRRFEIGLNIYPEALFVIHPVCNLNLRIF